MNMARKGIRFDVPLFLGVLALAGFGMVLIYSSSAPYAESRGLPDSFFLAQHFKKVLIGLIALFIGMLVPYRFWQKWALPLVILCVAMLAAIFITGADRIHGARRWFTIASFGLQPSEVAKLALIFYLAARLTARAAEMHSFRRGLLGSTWIVLVAFVLIVLQPNYSTALLVLLITSVMVFAGGARIAHLVMLCAVAVPALLLVMLSQPYRMQRIVAFLDPESNPASAYQRAQAMVSLGNGGLLGTGLGNGTQKLGYLPMPFTDFAYAIMGEEMGMLFGTMPVLLLFGLVIWRGLVIARGCNDRFGGLLATGLTVSLAFSAILHMAVNTGLIPVTGQPLPFVSYGGTSLVAQMLGMGVLLNISGAALSASTGPDPRPVWRSSRRASPLRPFTPSPRGGRIAGGRA
jgi:cell division protein FtsW